MKNKILERGSIFSVVPMSVLSFLYALGIGFVYLEKWHNIYFLGIAVAVFLLSSRFMQIAKTRLCVLSAVFSLFLTCAVTLDVLIDQENKIFLSFTGSFALGMPALWFALFVLTCNAIELCGRWAERNHAAAITPLRCGLFAGAVILLAWLVFFLSFYPAGTSIDSQVVIQQAIGNADYSDAHPFTYTLFAKLLIGIGMKLQGLTFGVGIFALAHLVFQCITAVYSICWMAKRGAGYLWLSAVTIYFALSPVFASLSITLWKDIPFSCCIVIFTIQLYQVISSGGTRLKQAPGCIKFILSAFFSAMLRHNGYYVVVVISLGLLIYYAIHMRKELKQYVRLMPALLIPVILVPAVQNIYYMAGVKPGLSSEAMSIPVQQLARTALSEDSNLSDSQLSEIEQFFDMEQLKNYDPFLSDPIKASLNKEYFDAHKGDFIKLWLSLLPGNLGQYVKAYILQTCGYWIPGIKQLPVDPNANYIEQLGVEKTNLLGALTENFESIQDVTNYDYLSTGSMFWLFLLCAAVLFYQKRCRLLFVFLPVLGVWGTLMVATPVHCSYRYIYALPLALPVFLFMALHKQQDNGRQQDDGNGSEGRIKEKNASID